MNNVRIVGGGSRSETWCQIVADNLGKTIWLPEVDEGQLTVRLAWLQKLLA